jgi:DNA-directed RNA polymerase subunit RPC12/RpoP
MVEVIILGPDYRVPTQPCLKCGHPIEGGFGFGNGEKPKEGSIILCIYCSHLQTLNGVGKFRELDEEERKHVLADPHVQLALEINRRKGNG